MYWEAMRTSRRCPGRDDVTDGSVDYYDTDWENVDNGALEEEMAEMWCRRPAMSKQRARTTTRQQTDVSCV
ncbi:MAG: hypothetical protein ACLVJH_19405 [Faecalibacterium prausnitzii]